MAALLTRALTEALLLPLLHTCLYSALAPPAHVPLLCTCLSQAAARGERTAAALQARAAASEEHLLTLGEQMDLQLAATEEELDEGAAARRATEGELRALRRRVAEVELVCTSLQTAMGREVDAAVLDAVGLLVPQAVSQVRGHAQCTRSAYV